jgi:hypothetical protein
MTYSLH